MSTVKRADTCPVTTHSLWLSLIYSTMLYRKKNYTKHNFRFLFLKKYIKQLMSKTYLLYAYTDNKAIVYKAWLICGGCMLGYQCQVISFSIIKFYWPTATTGHYNINQPSPTFWFICIWWCLISPQLCWRYKQNSISTTCGHIDIQMNTQPSSMPVTCKDNIW
jgi:hypothetical protein